MSYTRNSILKTLAKRIKERRKALGLSQEELAFRANLDRTYISGIERGTRNPTITSLISIIEALDLPVSVLFKDIEKEMRSFNE